MRKHSWSVGSGKMEDIPSLNTNTLTNEYCKKMSSTGKDNIICTHCYSFSMLRTFRKNCEPKFEENSKLLSEGMLTPDLLYFYGFMTMSKVNRFHSHGELINSTHFYNLLLICECNPCCTFSLWTKRRNLVSDILDKVKKPKNLILVYSNPRLDKPLKNVPRYFDKTFNNITYEDPSVNCNSKCKDCMMCYTIGDTNKQIVEVVK